MRARAEGVLRSRFQVLLDRSKRRALTVVERRELDGLGRSLDDLLALQAPSGEALASVR
jgi:hypothetical protein